MRGIDKFKGRFAGHDDEVSSLSAILLDEEYYRLLVENRASASGVAVLSVEGLIPFKAKAWLDLSARRAGGQAVDEKSVEKHRNDVCRLATLLAGGERPAMSEGGPRRHAALPGGLRVGPRRPQGAQDQGRRGAANARLDSPLASPALAERSRSSTL